MEDDASEEQEESTEPSELERFYLGFWPEMLSGLKLDDPSQPSPKSIGKIGNIFYPMPPSANQAWLSVFFYQQKNNTGVFLTFRKGSLGDMIYEKLLIDKDNIEKELGAEVEWESKDGKHLICAYRHYDDVKNVKYREEIKAFLREKINLFVNVFRPRLENISNEL